LVKYLPYIELYLPSIESSTTSIMLLLVCYYFKYCIVNIEVGSGDLNSHDDCGFAASQRGEWLSFVLWNGNQNKNVFSRLGARHAIRILFPNL